MNNEGLEVPLWGMRKGVDKGQMNPAECWEPR